jgi:hypothetical protein
VDEIKVGLAKLGLHFVQISAGKGLFFLKSASRTAAKTTFPPNYFHFCISVILVSKPLLPSLYKGFVAVGNPVF